MIQRSVTVQRISWHPSKQVLAMGWRSGEVTLCNVKEDKVWEQSSCHHGPITLVQWAGAGTRLVTADRVRKGGCDRVRESGCDRVRKGRYDRVRKGGCNRVRKRGCDRVRKRGCDRVLLVTADRVREGVLPLALLSLRVVCW